LGLFKFISDYLPYFEKINIFFNIRAKKVWINLSGLIAVFVRFIRNNLNQVVHTLAQHKNCDQSLNIHAKYVFSNTHMCWDGLVFLISSFPRHLPRDA
jgi:hypothetical protein